MRQTQKLTTKMAFTLAETLIALAVIGIVAALTIPGIVKNYNEHAWSTGKDVFTKKLDVALKEMNTNDTLTGYKTTAAFVNELKKNIKITQICTDDVTKCFAKNIQVRQYNGEVTLTNDNAIECETRNGQDWAENVGIRFANGVNAIISYNKNCYSDPYNNQFSPSPACIGIIYDVSGNKKPNATGKDIGANANVVKAGGKAFCAYEFQYTDNSGKKQPVCFTKVLAPDTGYSPLPITKADGSKIYCSTVKDELGISNCYYGETDGKPSEPDYWAGAAYACGGKNKIASDYQLGYLATYLYGYNGVIGKNQTVRSGEGYKRKDELLGPFHILDYSEGDNGTSYFCAWTPWEVNYLAGGERTFYANSTWWYSDYYRCTATKFAVCVE